jgi:hypothetical protein
MSLCGLSSYSQRRHTRDAAEKQLMFVAPQQEATEAAVAPSRLN